MPVKDTIQSRRGSSAQWSAANPILADGEIGYDSTTKQMKVGDGVTAWNALAYSTPGHIATNTVLANTTGGTANPVGTSVTDMRTLLSSVAYASQTLTNEQKLQARINIGLAVLPKTAPALLWDFAGRKSAVPVVGPPVVLTRSTVARYVNSSGLIAEAVVDEIPIQHALIDGVVVPLGLLVEPAATNNFLSTSDMTNVNWTPNNVVVTASVAGDPMGTATANRLTESTDGSPTFHRIYQGVSVTSGQVYTSSIFVKPETCKHILFFNTSNFRGFVAFDLDKLGVCPDGDYGAVGRIEPYSNGWLRISVTNTAIGTGTANIQWWLLDGVTTGGNYTGSGTRTLLLWNAQFESGPIATMPITTAGAPVARTAPTCVASGAGLTGILGSAMTLEVDVVPHAGNGIGTLISLDDNTANNKAEITVTGGLATATIASGGASQMSKALSEKLSGRSIERFSLALQANNSNVAKNGVVETVDTSVALPVSPTQLRFGPFHGCISRVALVPARMTDDLLVAETLPRKLPSEFRNFVLDGNSLTVGIGATQSSSYPAQMMRLLGDEYNHMAISVPAVGGQSTADMNTDRASQIHPLIISGRTIIVVWEVTNSLVYGIAPRTVIDQLWVYCDAVRALGAKVIVPNTLPRVEGGGVPAGFNVQRKIANDLMAAEWTAHADEFVDLAGTPAIGQNADAANITYYTDGTHLTAAGYALVAEVMANAVRRLV